MTVTLYETTIATAKACAKTLTHLLDAAQSQPNPDHYLTARLHPSMNPFTFQIHGATNFCEKILARVTGREPIAYAAEDVLTYDAMRARIATVLAALDAADEKEINEKGAGLPAPIDVAPGQSVTITAKEFAMGAAMPNIVFHVSMAYAILRMEGVPLGKPDYIMDFMREFTDLPL